MSHATPARINTSPYQPLPAITYMHTISVLGLKC